MSIYAVIMAGGVGSRFWPRSRTAQPKQFLNVFGEVSLIQSTVARLGGLIPPTRCFVVTHARYLDETLRQLPELPAENILIEPISRNTAPCIAYAAVHIHALDPEATLVVLPADHVIQDTVGFHTALQTAIATAQEPDRLVTLGLTPTRPETGYGYIRYAPPATPSATPAAYPVLTFTEKPDAETAQQFLASGEYLWNSGMFIWRADTILEQFARHLPEVHAAFAELRAAETETGVEHAFEQCPSISIDYGIMEQATSAYVVPAAFGWSDVGDWRAVQDLTLKDDAGNAVRGEAVVLDSTNCLVETGKRLVVLVGVADLLVVETEDAVLVCHRNAAQQVKDVQKYLSAEKPEYT